MDNLKHNKQMSDNTKMVHLGDGVYADWDGYQISLRGFWMDHVPPGEPLKALTWKQPYAGMMLHGKLETRSWATKHRGWVLICAGAKPYKPWELQQLTRLSVHALYGSRVMSGIFNIEHPSKYNPESEALGVAIAVGRLVNCRQMTRQDESRAGVDYSPDLYVHEYADVTPILPFPWKGSQRWRNVPEDVRLGIVMVTQQEQREAV